ncbi:putative sodium hydrogen exchanger [Chloropicon primus]|uniref:Putative sodium hydrogen exchanger n=1 Tax=Chloropicon primus TaxID=1764295 RepID=A0A5B8MF38_9CHLO|nr:putative sodium hydrogen exchanger [Chloropicon primus]|mmetsp:Transcript_3621/g.10259  ORF Transcript_3621/g.10259 Transcript_3621/m.10259 type:complete len:419 (+) Transcript_3621:230-1486(+)|eukprot:QDZ19258.1 putative sodium hydrogen exchanger [Chloropicon primus]
MGVLELSRVARHYLSAALLLPTASAVGQLCQRHLKLALITGFFVSGVLCGPSCLGFLTSDALRDLEFIEKVCLGLIGISAGSELRLKELGNVGKQILWLVLSICVATWVIVFSSTMVLLPKTTLASIVSSDKIPILSSIVATIMLARSPASAVAVLKELEAKGPFATVSLAVIIVKDVIVIVLFSLNLATARLSFHREEESAIITHALTTLFKINVAAALGVFGAFVQRKLFSMKIGGERSQRKIGCLYLVASAAFVFYTSELFGAEPLLACLVLGATKVNLEPNPTKKDFVSVLHDVMPTIYMAFFALAGASVHIDTLPHFFQPAFFVYSARLLSLYAGTKIGSKLGGSAEEHKEIGWMAYVTQAGIAMGLSKSVLLQFPEWAGPFFTFLVCIILMNQVTGPTMYKAALTALGETKV